MKICLVQKSETLERNANNFGREFWSGLCLGESKPNNCAGKFAEEFAEKFVGNSPNIRQTQMKKLKPNLLCRTSGSRNSVSIAGENFEKCWC